ncbi:MAG: hypothetical protein ACR2LC_09640 [Pyrinomonadaceae bacterium]
MVTQALKSQPTSTAQSSVAVRCGTRGCSRTSLAIENTANGLALAVTHRHDGEWHTTRITMELIEKLLLTNKNS